MVIGTESSQKATYEYCVIMRTTSQVAWWVPRWQTFLALRFKLFLNTPMTIITRTAGTLPGAISAPRESLQQASDTNRTQIHTSLMFVSITGASGSRRTPDVEIFAGRRRLTNLLGVNVQRSRSTLDMYYKVPWSASHCSRNAVPRTGYCRCLSTARRRRE